jgi:acetyl/propionyl-CoA carboxylase alpha subunit
MYLKNHQVRTSHLEIGNKAAQAALATSYRNAGTLEFLVDKQNRYDFMKMNTPLQVEHPLTEQITGLNLLKEQIRIPAGMPLQIQQENCSIPGARDRMSHYCRGRRCRFPPTDRSRDSLFATRQPQRTR